MLLVEELKDKGGWEDFLRASHDGTFYHSLQWKEVVEKSFHDSPLYLTISDANRIVGICPGFIQSSMRTKIYLSMPYSDCGGPVIAKHCLEQASLSLRDYLRRRCSSLNVAYLSVNFIDGSETFLGPASGYVDTSQGTVEIDLEAKSSRFIWDNVFSKPKRRNMRRVEREGYRTRQARTESDLQEFYSLYCDNMKYIGARAYPYEFLKNMWTLLYPQNLRIWLLAKEEAIGGILVLKDTRKTYSFLVGINRKQALIRSFRSVVPYLCWKEIVTAEEEGHKCVSLGATSSDATDPYYVQKTSLGGSFIQQRIVRYPCSHVGRFLLQTRATAAASWRTVRRFIPHRLKNRLKDSVGRRFGP